MRGNVARTHRNRKTKNIDFKGNKIFNIKNGVAPPIKIVAEINLIKIIFMYSAMKIKAKFPALYSTLNPETISDSPSAKSNGARLVSARVVINHIARIGGMIIRIHIQI